MPGDDESKVSVSFTADVSDLKSGAKEAADAVRDASEAFGEAGATASDAAAPTEGFVRTLRDFKTEGASAHRTAGFIARELLEIIPGAEGARSALQGVISIGLEGVGVGSAITAAGLAMGYFATKTAEAEAVARTLRDTYQATFRSITDALEDVRRSFSGPLSKTDEVWDEQLKRMRREIADLKQQRADLEDHPSIGRQIASGLTFGFVPEVDPDKTGQIDAQIEGKESGLDAARSTRTNTEMVERDHMNEEIATKTRLTEAETSDEIVRIHAEMVEKLSELNKRRDLDGDQHAKLAGSIERDAATKIADVRLQRQVEVDAQLISMAAETGSAKEKIEADYLNKIEALGAKYAKRPDDPAYALLKDALDREKAQKDSQADAEALAKEQSFRERMLGIASMNASEEQKLQSEKQQHLLELQAQFEVKSASMRGDELAKLKAQYAEEVKAYSDAMDAKARKSLKTFDTHHGDLVTSGGNEETAKKLDELRADQEKEKQDLDAWHSAGLIDEQGYQSRLAQVVSEGAKKRTDILNEENKKQAEQYMRDFVRPVVSSFDSAIKEMITGQKSFAQVADQLWKSLANDAINGILKMAETAVEKSIETLLTTKTTALSEVESAAAVAAANAYAATAAIPFVGPELAPGVAATTYASVMATYGPLASASGGYDIPAGINPLVQTHAQEMILPANIANPLRESIANGNLGGGSASGGDIHVHVNAIDAQSVRDFVSSTAFARAINEARRNGRF